MAVLTVSIHTIKLPCQWVNFTTGEERLNVKTKLQPDLWFCFFPSMLWFCNFLFITLINLQASTYTGQVFLSRSLDVGITPYCGNSRINVEMEYSQSRVLFFKLGGNNYTRCYHLVFQMSNSVTDGYLFLSRCSSVFRNENKFCWFSRSLGCIGCCVMYVVLENTIFVSTSNWWKNSFSITMYMKLLDKVN